MSMEYSIGGGWGNAIHWTRPEQFNGDLTKRTLLHVHGWKTPLPRKGDTLKGEFQKSWMWFEFVKIEPCNDPPDMFFAEVRIIRQELK